MPQAERTAASFPIVVGVNRRLRLIIFGMCLLAPGTTSCSGTAEEPNPATPQATAATSATPSEPIQEASPGSPTQSAKTPGDAAPTPTVTTPELVDCRVANCVALTYDDGPSPLTNQLLDTFESRQAVATLFLNGQYVDDNPNPILRAKQLGMEIGNHTTSHPHLPELAPEAIDFEIADTQQRIQAVTGSYPTLLRPPYGERNALVDQVAGNHGLAVIGWTDSPADWQNTDMDTVVALTLSRVRPGAIILMHDTHQWTVDAAPQIIDGLRAQGYTLVTVSQIIGAPEPGMLYVDGQAPA